VTKVCPITKIIPNIFLIFSKFKDIKRYFEISGEDLIVNNSALSMELLKILEEIYRFIKFVFKETWHMIIRNIKDNN
jgi:hypothetical protein